MRKQNNYKDFLKAYKRKKRLKGFYTKEIKDGKSRRATILDGIFFKLIVIFVLYLFISYFIDSLILSGLISGVLFTLYLYISYKIKNKLYNKRIEIINKKISNDLIETKLVNLSNEDFLEYSKDILEKYYKADFYKSRKENIDLVGKIDNKAYGVKAIRMDLDNRVSLRDLSNFIDELGYKNIKKAIIITNSYFTEEVKEQVADEIELIDYDEIIKILKRVGSYPIKAEIEDIIYSRQEEKRREILEEGKKIFDLNKVSRYFVLAIVLWLSSYIVSYPLYYRVVSTLSLLIGIIGIKKYIVEYIRHKEERSLNK